MVVGTSDTILSFFPFFIILSLTYQWTVSSQSFRWHKGTSDSNKSFFVTKTTEQHRTTAITIQFHGPLQATGMIVRKEMCQSALSGEECPLGSRCKFAHSRKELALTTILERLDAGIVDDVNAFRSTLCFDHIATGSW